MSLFPNSIMSAPISNRVFFLVNSLDIYKSYVVGSRQLSYETH